LADGYDSSINRKRAKMAENYLAEYREYMHSKARRRVSGTGEDI
jgi:hypothetical protein